jgi:hypothetical protein
MSSQVYRHYATIAFISRLVGAGGGGVFNIVFGARQVTR